MRADELAAQIQNEIDEIKTQNEAYDERLALSMPDDGLSTDQRATAALGRKERFPGEHQVACAWLLSSKTARTWKSNGHV